jgi:hypothetical protein
VVLDLGETNNSSYKISILRIFSHNISVGCLKMLLQYGNDIILDERLIGRDLGVIDRGLVLAVSRNLPGGTEEYH